MVSALPSGSHIVGVIKYPHMYAILTLPVRSYFFRQIRVTPVIIKSRDQNQHIHLFVQPPAACIPPIPCGIYMDDPLQALAAYQSL